MTERCGTTGYMAPEVLSLLVGKEGYTTVVDVWGFGMVLFEMITGKVCALFLTQCRLLFIHFQMYFDEHTPVKQIEFKNKMMPFIIHDQIIDLIEDKEASQLLHSVSTIHFSCAVSR